MIVTKNYTNGATQDYTILSAVFGDKIVNATCMTDTDVIIATTANKGVVVFTTENDPDIVEQLKAGFNVQQPDLEGLTEQLAQP